MTDLRSTIQQLGPWFHNLRLPDGTHTCPDHPLGDFPRNNWVLVESHLLRSLAGLSVLDIGCNAGFYTFEMARRGAEVTALDVDARYLAQARWAAKLYDLDDRIEFQQASVYSLATTTRRWTSCSFWGSSISYATRCWGSTSCLAAPGSCSCCRR